MRDLLAACAAATALSTPPRLPDPALSDPALSDPALSDPALSDPALPVSASRPAGEHREAA
ncbi:hypothetical protein [Streptomyces sp. NPDC006134]|uniref:hypothetical protein n=1 Tax=Streptomyces sp. NPDC006134 TaxID=3154467 RepID=UPI0033E15C73